MLAYTNLLQVHSGFNMDVLQHIFESRSDLPKRELKDIINRCKWVWKCGKCDSMDEQGKDDRLPPGAYL